MYNSDTDLRNHDDYGENAANSNYYGKAPKDNLRITIGSKSSVSKFSFMTKRERIPGLDGPIFLPPKSRSVEIFQLEPRVTDHSKDDLESDDVPDDILYHTQMGNDKNDSFSSHPSQDDYLNEIDQEYEERIEGISPLKQAKFQSVTERQREAVKSKKETRPTMEYDPYVDIDLMTFPPVYSKLLKEGCTEEVAEQFLGLVQDGLLGNVEWDSEHGENLLKSVSRKSQREEKLHKRLKDFFEEFRNMKFLDQSTDKFHLFKKMCQLFSILMSGSHPCLDGVRSSIEINYCYVLQIFYRSLIQKRNDDKAFAKAENMLIGI